MPKKIIQLTENEFRTYVKGIVKENLQASLNSNEVLPHSDDIFNLDEMPIEILDRGYVRYEPYNLGITHRHPLRKVSESRIYKENIEKAKRVILSTYPISDEQFVIRNGHNGMYAAILVSLVENNVDIIEEAMLKLGFFRSKPTDENLLCDKKERKWIDLRFEPTPSNDLTEFVRKNYDYVYHLAPSIFEQSIKESGLQPSNNNSEFEYHEPRVYVIKGQATANDIQELANELYQQAKQKGYPDLSKEYSIFKIDLSKIDNSVRFYGDINEEQGLFVLNPISPQAIAGIKRITAIE